jgi:hypothetical protein
MPAPPGNLLNVFDWRLSLQSTAHAASTHTDFYIPWRWRRYVPPKHRLTQYIHVHNATSQMATLFIITAVKTSNLTYIVRFPWFSSVPPGKFSDSTSNRLRSLPSKSFPIQHSSMTRCILDTVPLLMARSQAVGTCNTPPELKDSLLSLRSSVFTCNRLYRLSKNRALAQNSQRHFLWSSVRSDCLRFTAHTKLVGYWQWNASFNCCWICKFEAWSTPSPQSYNLPLLAKIILQSAECSEYGQYARVPEAV